MVGGANGEDGHARPAPLCDPELIPLPFLLFANSRLRTANAGARVLLGLSDPALDRYAYEDIFPSAFSGSAAAASRSGNAGHLQVLRARVQSSQELLKLKSAVYTSESDGSLRSILIVDVSLVPTTVTSTPTSPVIGTTKGAGRRASVSTGANAASEQEPATAPSHNHRPSLPAVVKRHSGDIKRIFSHERRKPSISQKDGPTSTPLVQAMSIDSPGVTPDTSIPEGLQDQTPIVSAMQEAQQSSYFAPIQPPAPQSAVSKPIERVSSSHSQASLRLSPPISPTAASLPTFKSRNSNSDRSHSSGASHKSRSTMSHSSEGAEFTAGLAQTALAAHPRTGVIICKNDVSSGFINSRTRELLLGIKSPEHELSDPFDDQFFSPASARQYHAGRESDDGSDLSPAWEDEIFFEDGQVRIDLPEKGNNLRTSISDILRWSLRRRRARQHLRQMNDGASVRTGQSYSPANSVYGAQSFTSNRTTTSTEEGGTVKGAERPWLADKPYRVYDTTFSQRVEDPFEMLFDLCVRDGRKGQSEPIAVGIETEVGPAESCAFPESECFTYITESIDADPNLSVKTRVRRRVVNVRAAPLRDVEGNHIGGVVWIRDMTGETDLPATKPSVAPGEVGAPAVHGTVQPGFQAPVLDPSAGSDPFWQQIVNSMPQMVWVTRPDGQHIYFNNKWYAYTGLQPEQSLGVNWQNPFASEDMPRARRAWSRSLATGEPYSTEYRCRRYDGVMRWHLGRAQAMLDANGQIVAWFGTCTDIEDSVKMREKLAETTQNFKNVIELANITLLAVDKNLQLLFMEGGSMLKSLDKTGDLPHAIGAFLSEIIPAPGLVMKAQEVAAGQLGVTREELCLPSGVYIQCQLTPLRYKKDDPISGVAIVAWDITDRKEAEEALRHSNEEQSRLLASERGAKEASRLKSEFTANLSHEIRTPITGMIGMSELLLEDALTPSQQDSVQKILRSGEILLKMVGDVLDLGKVEAGKLDLDVQPFVLSDLISDASTMFRTAAKKKGLRFDEVFSDLYSGEILGDLPRMRQVLLNFLANSVKFTRQGFIRLQVSQEEESASFIRVRFVVEDSGIGIEKKVIPLLFKAYQQADSTTSREHGGTGLGLVISKKLVEIMQGSVQLDSEPGRGTKITITVPFIKHAVSTHNLSRRPSNRRTETRTSSRSSSSTPTDSPSGSRLQVQRVQQPVEELHRDRVWILLAEDNLLNAEIFVRAIKRMGFNVKHVPNGRLAVDAMSERNWDLCILDCQMPVCDGLEATRLIRQSSISTIRDATIIALTASAISGDRERCIAAGMDDYLAKPIRLKVLEETILKHLLRLREVPSK